MSTDPVAKPLPTPMSRPPTAEGTRPPRTPLTPARVGESIGEETNPEQDVAPNLGGEEQMQDS